MELEEALTAHLKAQSGLTALVGQRIYPDEIPQGTKLPCVCYIKISDIKEHQYIGQDSFERPVYQLTAFAATKPSARQVTNQLKAALSDYCGDMSGIEVQKIELQTEMSSLVTTADGTTRTYTEYLEYEINYIRR